jgi:type II restriction enzyme
MDSALGMTATSRWKGKFDATGGYIIVKEDGELVCYHIYNLNDFQDYLLENTKLESPSTSKYEYAKVYEEKGDYYFRLNLQIRFI